MFLRKKVIGQKLIKSQSRKTAKTIKNKSLIEGNSNVKVKIFELHAQVFFPFFL